MADCIFCKIVAGEIPAARLIETDKVLSFLDIGPVNPGHALVIPKRHAESLLDLTQEELHVMSFIARRVAAAVRDAVEAEGFNILQNEGRVAGQLVPHVHFHVIPRRGDDGFELGWRQGQYGAGEMDAMMESIRQRL